jgi:predicted O-linked N-acetylglucosamine transferase (SPINDLY family)
LGADYIDYVIGDSTVIPKEHFPYYAEKVVYLPDTFMANDLQCEISERSPTRAEMGLPERGLVFCAFNNNTKIRPQLFDIWIRLLREFDDSTLWLARSGADFVDISRHRADSYGVDPRRLVFAPPVPRREDHLARHKLADLFLDTLPYNAHSTACDALSAGLPVLTCLGHAFPGRVAASLLRSVGLPDLVTYSLAEYEALATTLAQDSGRLRQVRDKLAANRLTFPLFDTARFTRHFETAFEMMHEIHIRGEPPRHFEVAPVGRA